MVASMTAAVSGARLRAEEACARAEVVLARARTLVEDSRLLRQAAERAGSPRYFVLRGEVEGHPVRAMWFRGSLLASPELRQRAEVLVALGARFRVADQGRALTANLDEPAAALLTMIRACDRVRVAEFGAAPRGARSGAADA